MISYDDYSNKVLTRADLSQCLYHFTRGVSYPQPKSALDVLIQILVDGRINGSGNNGFIKGNRPAACFMDIPFHFLKYILTPLNQKRYEPYGIFFTKEFAYRIGARPVCYLSDEEYNKIDFPPDEQWRVGRFEMRNRKIISFMHEREWRCPDDFILAEDYNNILVKSSIDAKYLGNYIKTYRHLFPAKRYIIFVMGNMYPVEIL